MNPTSLRFKWPPVARSTGTFAGSSRSALGGIWHPARFLCLQRSARSAPRQPSGSQFPHRSFTRFLLVLPPLPAITDTSKESSLPSFPFVFLFYQLFLRPPIHGFIICQLAIRTFIPPSQSVSWKPKLDTFPILLLELFSFKKIITPLLLKHMMTPLPGGRSPSILVPQTKPLQCVLIFLPSLHPFWSSP